MRVPGSGEEVERGERVGWLSWRLGGSLSRGGDCGCEEGEGEEAAHADRIAGGFGVASMGRVHAARGANHKRRTAARRSRPASLGNHVP